jgi:hypothetical protein
MMGSYPGQSGSPYPAYPPSWSQRPGSYGALAPQSFFGDLLGTIAQPVGQQIGSWFGSPQTGAALGGLAGQLGQFLPFQAGVPGALPNRPGPYGALAPQSIFGGMLGGLGGGALGGFIGDQFGSQQMGSDIGTTLGGFLGGLLPFQAGVPGALPNRPGPYGALAPQSFFGDLLGTIAQPVGQQIGSWFGSPQTGAALGGLAGQLGQFLPFQAGVPAYYR